MGRQFFSDAVVRYANPCRGRRCSVHSQLPWRPALGGMAERTKAPVLKTGGPGNGSRGFESHSLRPSARVRGRRERWPSGRRRSPAKRVGGRKPPRGFKSLPLRRRARCAQDEGSGASIGQYAGFPSDDRFSPDMTARSPSRVQSSSCRSSVKVTSEKAHLEWRRTR